MSRIVADTGPLISLEKLSDGYDLLRQLYEQLVVPPVVLEEIAQGQHGSPEAYLQHYDIADFISVHPVSPARPLPEAERLHEGEAQAIQLALELRLPLLIEERAGRQVAAAAGLQISGIAGQVLLATRKRVLSVQAAQRHFADLLAGGRIGSDLYEAMLEALTSLGGRRPGG